MRDLDHVPEDGAPARILLARIRDAWWLIEGEDHLGDMLADRPGFPTPVLFVRFEGEPELRRFLDGAPGPAGLWGINPAVIARLMRKDQLAEVEARAA